jgi:hypothetical protein
LSILPVEVEKLILQRNKTHFSQARDTPLATSQVSSILSYSGTSSISDQLLKGTIDASAVTSDKFGKAILGKCAAS